MDLMEAINNACRDLPIGYTVHLGMENGAAWVELSWPDRIKEFGFSDNIDGADRTLAEQIEYAVSIALETEKGG